MLNLIAETLNVSKEELKEKDQRIPTEDLLRLQTMNPQFGFALRRAVSYIQQQNLSPQDMLRRICSESQPPDNVEKE